MASAPCLTPTEDLPVLGCGLETLAGPFVIYQVWAFVAAGLYKTERIHRDGPWKHLEAVEFATLEWVDWFNNRRLLGSIGDVPPSEFECAYHQSQETPAMGAGLN